MANDIVTLDGVTIRLDAHGRYCLNDMHRAAIANGKATENHSPNQFLRNDGVKAFVAAVDLDQTAKLHSAENISKVGIPALVPSVKITNGGKNPGTYADELVAIRYAAALQLSSQ